MNFPSNIIRAEIAESGSDAKRPLAFVSLGSNQMFEALSPVSIVLAASHAVAELAPSPVLMSSLWETEPVDCPPGSPSFVNAVMALSPRINDPFVLLAALQMIEQKFGRNRSGLINGPRSLDLDLLLFGGVEINTPELVLPHPRMHLRRFVLAPLLEIAPEYRPAGSDLSGTQILAGLPEQGVLRRMKIAEDPVIL